MSNVLLLASRLLPAARQLEIVARKLKWRVYALDEEGDIARMTGPGAFRRTFFGGTDRADEYARRFELALIEPPLDLLARVPPDFLGRTVRFGTLARLRDVRGSVFVKPADPILRAFDAGIWRSVSEVRGRAPLPPDLPVLVSEPVEWSSEFRAFVREGRIEAWSPYLSFGRPSWSPHSAGPTAPPSLVAFCDRLTSRIGDALPPAFVVDVGVLEDGRWAVVEFNPAWCAGILGADPQRVLPVVARSACWRAQLSPDDRVWVRLGA